MSGMPWDKNSWDVAAEIAMRHHHHHQLSARSLISAQADIGVTDTPLVLRETNSLPQLVMKTVIVPGKETDEGLLIEAVTLPWFDIIEEIRRPEGRLSNTPAGVGRHYSGRV
jgi:hypothetical protein